MEGEALASRETRACGLSAAWWDAAPDDARRAHIRQRHRAMAVAPLKAPMATP